MNRKTKNKWLGVYNSMALEMLLCESQEEQLVLLTDLKILTRKLEHSVEQIRRELELETPEGLGVFRSFRGELDLFTNHGALQNTPRLLLNFLKLYPASYRSRNQELLLKSYENAVLEVYRELLVSSGYVKINSESSSDSLPQSFRDGDWTRIESWCYRAKKRSLGC